jgi:hypothetical protein
MLDLLIKIGILGCPYYIISMVILKFFYKKSFSLRNKICLTLCLAFTIVLVVIDIVSDRLHGYISAMFACLVMWLFINFLGYLFKLILKFFKD